MKPCNEQAGLSLIEILAVIAIMSLLLALAGPSIVGVQGAFQISQAGHEVRTAFSEARLAAVAVNRLVEVRMGFPVDAGLGNFVCVVEYDTQGTPQLFNRVMWFGLVTSRWGAATNAPFVSCPASPRSR